MATKYRGNTLSGRISTPYLLAINLHHASVDHANHCDSSACNVAVGRLREAANWIMNDPCSGPAQDELNNFNSWEWPL